MMPRTLYQLDFLKNSLRAHSDLSECLIWPYGKKRHGYGQVWDGLHNRRPHRIVYEMIHGPIPRDLKVLHECDNGSCYNPAHLSLGTQQENIRQAVERGRFRGTGAKLTLAEAREIKDLYATENLTQKQIGERFGVNEDTVWRIVNKRRWKNA